MTEMNMDILAYETEIALFTKSYIKQQGYHKYHHTSMSVCRVV